MTVCPNQESMGYHYDGGFAEYMIVPGQGARGRRPEPHPRRGLGFDEASVAEPLACVLNGQELARVGDGDDVVVIGAGPIGCLHVRLARVARRRPGLPGRPQRRAPRTCPPSWSRPTPRCHGEVGRGRRGR